MSSRTGRENLDDYGSYLSDVEWAGRKLRLDLSTSVLVKLRSTFFPMSKIMKLCRFLNAFCAVATDIYVL